ncbi:MAG: hypothetical protein Q7S64_03050 [bacterium]|nr:hypothetical protein [bacterium]
MATKKFFGLTLLAGLMLSGSLLVQPLSAQAANDGDLVQAVGDSKVYLIEGSSKRYIPTADVMQGWGFNAGMVRRISKAELNGHPNGPRLTRLIQWGGAVYFVENGQKRYVPNAESLAFYGVTFASLTDVNTSTHDRLSTGAELSAPRTVRIPNDNKVYLLEDGVRRPFADDTSMAAWGYSREGTAVSAAAKSIPVGPKVANVVENDGNVYAVENGKRRHVISDSAVLTNGYKWENVTHINGSTRDTLAQDNPIRPNALIRATGETDVWFMDADTRHLVPDETIMNAWGYNTSQIVDLPRSIVYKYSEGSKLSRYIKTGGDTKYYIVDGKHKKVTNETIQKRIFGIKDGDQQDMGETGFQFSGDGGELTNGLTTFEGYNIPIDRGKTAKEQHLYLNKAEADLGRTNAGADKHYADSSTPTASRNGMAGGYGAFGSEASPASIDQERYYITMRWNYCEWYEDSGNLDSFGRTGTYCRNLNSTAKSWHRHKRVIVTNPSNGKQVVVSVEESGPAIWTGRVSGLSPEAMDAVGAVTNTELYYYWAGDQNISLGPLN